MKSTIIFRIFFNYGVVWALYCTQCALHHYVAASQPVDALSTWNGNTVRDLHQEYYNIFRHGNRNAASHLWSSFLLERSHTMTAEKLKRMFSGFCAVSGSPVNPHDYNRYGLLLEKVPIGNKAQAQVSATSAVSTISRTKHMFGYMHYCCWPCVCDTQDFIKIDSKTIQTKDKGAVKFYFAVLGNPCDHPSELNKRFVQPFDGRTTTLKYEAPEVRCDVNGTLKGATYSDNGYIIISMFFDAVDVDATSHNGKSVEKSPQPGRLSKRDRITYQDEHEYLHMCQDRAQQGYNSGMGEIFRKVAAISPISTFD